LPRPPPAPVMIATLPSKPSAAMGPDGTGASPRSRKAGQIWARALRAV
jgi:hypothetical protein